MATIVNNEKEIKPAKYTLDCVEMLFSILPLHTHSNGPYEHTG